MKIKKLLLIFALCVPSFMIGVDLLCIGVAIAPMAKTFRVDIGMIQWMITAFGMGNAAFLTASGHLSDVFGRKKIYILGLILFTLSSLAIALLPNIYWEIVARFVQGATGGLMVTSAVATIMTVLPDNEKVKWVGALIGSTGLGMAVGPIVGGFLIYYMSWRAIFYLNALVGLSALLLAWVAVPVMKKSEGMRLDIAGIVLIVVSLVSVILLISQCHQWGFISVSTIVTLVVFVVSVAMLILIELKLAAPLLRFSVLLAKGFIPANFMGFCIYAALTSYLLIWGLYFEKLHNASPLRVALYLLPIGVVMFVGSLLSGFITAHFTKLQAARWGSVLCVLSTLALGLMSVHTPSTYFYCAFAVFGFGFYLVNSTTFPLAIAHVDAQYIGIGSGMSLMSRWFGGAVGSAVSATIYQVSAKHQVVGYAYSSQLYQSLVGHKNLMAIAHDHAGLLAIQHDYNKMLNVCVSHCMYFIAFILLLSFLFSLIFMTKQVDA